MREALPPVPPPPANGLIAPPPSPAPPSALPVNPLVSAPPREDGAYKSPLLRIPKDQRHQFERVALAVEAEIRRQKQLVRDYIAPPPTRRPAFAIPLTPEEKQAQFLSEGARMAVIRSLAGKPDEIRKFLDEANAYAEEHRP